MFKSAVAASLVAWSGNLAASVMNNQANLTHEMEHISIYANRYTTAQQQVLASVTVLERADIMARQADDLPNLLSQLVGINLSRDGGRGQNASVYIRGGNTGHSLVLIDGVRLGSATLGYKALSMVPLELIERIEVIRGPRAAFYGADALSGIIAITTRRSNAVLEVNANTGSYGQVGADISASHTIDALILRATVGGSRADGFNSQPNLDADKDGYQQQFAKLAADYQTRFGLWQVQTDLSSGRYQFDSAWNDEDQADSLNRNYLLGWQHQLGQWQHQLQLSRSLDNDTSFGSNSRSPFMTERDELNYQAYSQVSSSVTLLGGVNWYQEQVERSATAYEQTSRINRALFTGVSYQQNGLQLEAAARRDMFDQYGAENTWQLAVGYQFLPHWLVRASRATAFKIPSFNALYYPGYANPNLKPEQSLADELALRYNSAQLQLELSWFQRDVTNLIQGIKQAENITLSKIVGIELSMVQQWSKFTNEIAYTWLDTKNVSTGNKLERRPENTLNWRLSYAADDWSAFVTADYQSATFQGDFAPEANVSSFTLWGLGASYQLSSKLSLRTTVNNLFNKQYQTSAGYATAGANVKLSLSYKL
ncbi:TonB-dependent receptor domain-containing protein [Rheinheimera sp. MMS21-TC3]|uniref:TonB-dependent receptor domain-containing protein n=1 Tax=Rheinheimera sp. MMS21-TC3 TaxID=3072790 RepID=UPI0028C4C2B1|nr:TonB-dependent receptor [Rheinheimera sp. MMS21-TC3]WNO61403.1 TonB-dependent receptor [Rheinheimera sp. MMS21-TC3]